MHVPDGYAALGRETADAVVRADAREAIAAALDAGTLYDFAAARATRTMQGRVPAYAVRLATGLEVVVRHNVHGGAFARLTGDRFLAPTRAPLELATSLRLRDAGIPTPAVVAIVRYPAGGPFERADVATELVPDAVDLAHVLLHEPAMHDAAGHATAALLRALAAAGARHADINIKNVLLSRAAGRVVAHVLDVDRVTFHAPGSAAVAGRNAARFVRSARKWRERFGAPISEAWLESVVRHAR